MKTIKLYLDNGKNVKVYKSEYTEELFGRILLNQTNLYANTNKTLASDLSSAIKQVLNTNYCLVNENEHSREFLSFTKSLLDTVTACAKIETRSHFLELNKVLNDTLYKLASANDYSLDYVLEQNKITNVEYVPSLEKATKGVKLTFENTTRTYWNNDPKHLFGIVYSHVNDLYSDLPKEEREQEFEDDILQAINQMYVSNYKGVTEEFENELDDIDYLSDELHGNSANLSKEEYTELHNDLVSVVEKFLSYGYTIDYLLQQNNIKNVEYLTKF